MARYRPILRWKQGEQIALRETYGVTKQNCVPLVQLGSHEYNPVAGQNVDPAFDRRVEQDARTLVAAWFGQKICVEFGMSYFEAICTNDKSPIEHFFDNLHDEDGQTVKVSPVVRFGSDHEAIEGICKICSDRNLTPTIRLTPDDIADISEPELQDIATKCGSTIDQIALILDLGFIQSEKRARFTALGVLASIPLLDDWESVTLAAGSFPDTLSQFSVGEHYIPRHEWALFLKVNNAINRELTYGDYATVHPILTDGEIDPRTMNASASVRYTVDENWLLLRGHGTRTPNKGGFDQFIDHARRLTAMPDYRGDRFSFGDQQIKRIADDKQSKGNLRTWVTIGVNHHIAEIVDQIAKIDDI